MKGRRRLLVWLFFGALLGAFFRLVLGKVLFLRFQQFRGCLFRVVDDVHSSLAREIVFRRSGRLLQCSCPLWRVFQQEFKRFPNVAVRLIVGIQVVLQLVDQAGECSEMVMDFDARMLCLRTHHRVVDSVRLLLDELDEELDALVRLIGDVANLLFLVRSERIFRALGVYEGRDNEK